MAERYLPYPGSGAGLYDHDIQLSVAIGRYDVAVDGDQQILASVITNPVQNALKSTRPGGHIAVRAHTVAIAC